MQLLTHSRMASARMCLRHHWYRYELGIVKDSEAEYYKFGKAFHAGLECWHKTQNPGEALAAALKVPVSNDYDHEILTSLIAAYTRLTEPIQFDRAEMQFEIPIINPDTKHPARNFALSGKIDGLFIDDAGRNLIIEHKTTSEDISPDSDYWLRLRVDPQISLYTLAARRMGIDICGVLYNVVRKPSIRPKQIPETDENDVKICVDDVTGERVKNKDGKSWKQSACEGCHLVTRDETPEEFGNRLLADINDRPDFYFARREIPILDDHLAEFESEVWQQQIRLRQCQLSGLWFRSISKFTCGNCQYAPLCLQSVRLQQNPDGSVQIPSGYIKSEPHEELFNVEAA